MTGTAFSPYIEPQVGEYGELYTITGFNETEMTGMENLDGATGTALNWLSDTVAIDFDGSQNNLDMEPIPPVPEPATFTLLGAGLAAGLIRKRLARKKA